MNDSSSWFLLHMTSFAIVSTHDCVLLSGFFRAKALGVRTAAQKLSAGQRTDLYTMMPTSVSRVILANSRVAV